MFGQLNDATDVLEEFDGDMDDLVDKMLPLDQVDPAASTRMLTKPKRGNLFLRSSRAAFNPGIIFNIGFVHKRRHGLRERGFKDFLTTVLGPQ